MEIIEEGRLPEDKVYEGRCYHCNTRARFKRSEGKLVYDQRDGDYVEVKCPLPGCNHTIKVSTR